VLLAASAGRITHLDYPVEVGLFWLATVVAFGVRRPAGAVLAGLVAATSPELLSRISEASYLPQVVSGLAAITLAMNADGVLALAEQRRFKRKHARQAQQAQQVRAPRRDETGDQAAAADPAVLEVRDVRAGYGDVEVIHGVSLTVRSGQVVALIGANGAGKSTLCSVVTGLAPAADGSVHLGGADVTALAPHRRVRHGVFLIPEGRGVFPALTVEENLSPWLPSEPKRDEAYARFPTLASRRGQLAGSLSGGEQQMLALAPALVAPPDLLVVDEPSLGLAPLIVADVYLALHELRDRGTAILLIEEKAHDVLALADTVAFMSAGRIAWERPTAEVDSDLLVRSYLGIADASGPAGDSKTAGVSATVAESTLFLE
jgi:ABC-type branched-subunit amino acid transport system ATPase component